MGLVVPGATLAWAAEPFVIKDIRVEGLQRTEPGTVFNYSRSRSAIPLTTRPNPPSRHCSPLVFADVRIETENNVVIVAIAERPVIAELNINGSKEFDSKHAEKGPERQRPG